MKINIMLLWSMVAVLLPWSAIAQDDSGQGDKFKEGLRLAGEYNNLQSEVSALTDSLESVKDRLYYNRKSWYSTCTDYLRKGELKEEELQSLIEQTIAEIDGDSLKNELLRAQKCIIQGYTYYYADVPAPSRDLLNVNPMPVDATSKRENKNSTKEQRTRVAPPAERNTPNPQPVNPEPTPQPEVSPVPQPSDDGKEVSPADKGNPEKKEEGTPVVTQPEKKMVSGSKGGENRYEDSSRGKKGKDGSNC